VPRLRIKNHYSLYNDGTPVAEALLIQMFRELREKFGAASWETQIFFAERGNFREQFTTTT